MASATSSRERKHAPKFEEFRSALGRASERAPVPMLVLRVPQLERVAWRDGRAAARRLEREAAAAFASACARILRGGDAAGHAPGSDVFLAALCAPSRTSAASRLDCRAVLERMAAAISLHTDVQPERGWTWVRGSCTREDVQHAVELALERGARERERYEFFAAVGHELRTPLTAIRGYLETLMEGGLDSPTSRRFLDTARREALRMGRLIEGMFEFSLLDLSAGSLLSSGCAVAERISLACEAVRPLAARRAIRVENACRTSAAAALEPDACSQLLVNLLENAVKYGRDGGRVCIAADFADGAVCVTVDDDGPGIVPADRERIFGLRVRGAQSDARPGTGIGLAIVKMIVERAGGSITVCDSPLGGARFEVMLPVWADSAAPAS